MAGFDEEYGVEQLRRANHPLRRIIKGFYLRNVLEDVIGPTIDLGCGAGQILRRLPSGSMGLEVNPYLVSKLAEDGFDVQLYDPSTDHYCLSDIPVGRFKTLVASHVLEHLSDLVETLHQLSRSCNRLGVERMVFIVPCELGYASDRTHQTFVNMDYLRKHELSHCEGYSVIKTRYFPLNKAFLGKYFIHHELKVLYLKDGTV